MTSILDSKVCMVTGASRGIGRSVAQELARAGGIVIGTATTDEGAQRISEYLGASGQGMRLDVNDPDDIEAIASKIGDDCGPISILVNNAGISKDGLAIRIKEDDWDAMLDTNLKSVYRLSKRFVRDMMKLRQGRIINISSVVGVAGNAGQTHYAASKAGIIGYSKSLAMETASRNITVNCVVPGYIDTDMTGRLKQDVKDKILANVPAGRMGSPDEVAHAVLFLASPGSSYITGTCLYVDGGMMRR